MARAIVFESGRSGYSIRQLFEGYAWNKPMTVGELRGILEDYDDDDYFVLSNDHGYTYGSISDQSEWASDEDGEWSQVW